MENDTAPKHQSLVNQTRAFGRCLGGEMKTSGEDCGENIGTRIIESSAVHSGASELPTNPRRIKSGLIAPQRIRKDPCGVGD